MARLRNVLAVAVVAGMATVMMGQGMGQGQGRGGAGRGRATSTLTQNRASPHDLTTAVVGGGKRVTIYYGRPYSHAPNSTEVRKIWGTLVPWGQVYRLGADESTTMVTQATLQFGNLEVPPGAYSLYMLPEENGASKLIINKAIGQWGIPYPPEIEKQELGRVDLTKADAPSQVDQLTLALTAKQGGGGGTIKITWENATYSVDFTAK
jgi:hypothetical protein